jgi:hypothetical protein
MSPDTVTYEALGRALRPFGLWARGGFHCDDEAITASLPEGHGLASVVLIGNLGGSLWPAFSESPEFGDGQANSLDRWSRRVIDGVARGFDAVALYPFGGPPHLPFQQWAMRAEGLQPSPLGALIHPDYGLWHAYRGALGFAERLALPPVSPRPRPCDDCADKPCLSTCPVGAFDGRGYDVPACAAHLDGPAGAACYAAGCLARAACPVGAGYHYGEAQANFHVAAFAAARKAEAV